MSEFDLLREDARTLAEVLSLELERDARRVDRDLSEEEDL